MLWFLTAAFKIGYLLLSLLLGAKTAANNGQKTAANEVFSTSVEVHAIPPAHMRPVKAMQPAHGTYFVTFASSDAFLEAWSRFPFSARIGEQALRRASVPSEAEPSYVDWFRVCSHPFAAPDEGLTVGPGPSQSRAEYVSF